MTAFKSAFARLAALTGLLSLAASAQAEKFVIGVEDLSYLPYYETKNAEYRGFARELLDAFARDSGHEFEYRPLPIKRLTAELTQGMVDFRFPDHEKWSLAEKGNLSISYSKPVVPYTDGVLVMPKRVGSGPEALKTLAVPRGFTPFDYVPMIQAGKLSLIETENLEAAIKMAMAGRADGAYGNWAVAGSLLTRKMGTPMGLVADPNLPNSKDHYKLSTTKHAEVIKSFDAWLDQHGSEVGTLKDKWKIK